MSARRRQRSGLRGVNSLRRTLRRIEPEAKTELKEAVEQGAEAILQDMIMLVPKDSGDLARLLNKRVARDGTTARIGLLTKKQQQDGFYARFLEYGTKGYAAGQTRFAKNSKTTTRVKRNVPARPAQPFIGPAFDLNKDWILERARKGIDLALARAAKGKRDD